MLDRGYFRMQLVEMCSYVFGACLVGSCGFASAVDDTYCDGVAS